MRSALYYRAASNGSTRCLREGFRQGAWSPTLRLAAFAVDRTLRSAALEVDVATLRRGAIKLCMITGGPAVSGGLPASAGFCRGAAGWLCRLRERSIGRA